MTSATPLTLIDPGVMLFRSITLNSSCLHFDTSLSFDGLEHSLLLSLYLEALTVEIIMLKNWRKCQYIDL